MAELTENDEEHANNSPTMTVPRSSSPRAFETSTKSVASVAFNMGNTGRRGKQWEEQKSRDMMCGPQKSYIAALCQCEDTFYLKSQEPVS